MKAIFQPLRKKLICIIPICTLLLPSVGFAIENVISDDGRQIQLNDDGSWIQVSKDRYATTLDGQRIRLKPTGRWVVMPKNQTEQNATQNIRQLNAPVVTQPLVIPNEDISILLSKAEILKKKTKMIKSTRIDTRTVFYLQLINNTDHEITLNKIDHSGITATSSGNDTFPIEDIRFSTSSIAVGQRIEISIFTEGSPKWFGAKYLSLQIDKNIISKHSAKILSINMDDVIKRTVSEF